MTAIPPGPPDLPPEWEELVDEQGFPDYAAAAAVERGAPLPEEWEGVTVFFGREPGFEYVDEDGNVRWVPLRGADWHDVRELLDWLWDEDNFGADRVEIDS